MNKHSHEALRGHITVTDFDAGIREEWRAIRYHEALKAHHTYSNDRPALLNVVHKLNLGLEAHSYFFSTSDRTAILDIGCGKGKVPSAILTEIDPVSNLVYIGIDKNSDILEAARSQLSQVAKQKALVFFHQTNYSEDNLGSMIFQTHRPFKMIWMIHSGYYLERNHIGFLTGLELLTASHGLIMLIHNPEGNAPFLAAAEEIGMRAYTIRYARHICPPTVSAEVFDKLRSSPGNLEHFTEHFAEEPQARSFRLMLEFYLSEYPLEALSFGERERYVTNWENHLNKEDWCFRNDHEVLLLLPRHHATVFGDLIDNLVQEISDNV